MKFFIKLIIIAVILMLIGCYFIIGANGMLLLTKNVIHYSQVPSFNGVRNKAKLFFSSDTSSQVSNTFETYKWKDQKGVIHYSDRNDPRYESKLTKLKGITILPVPKEEVSVKPIDPETQFSSRLPGFTTIPLQQIPKLIKDAKQVKKTMEERKDSLDQVLDAH